MESDESDSTAEDSIPEPLPPLSDEAMSQDEEFVGSLPKDPASPEFSDALQALREHYPDRTGFNFMVCEALAMRGVPPNGMAVLKVGRWGSSNAAGSDVRAWYSQLARKLRASTADIPEAARIQANTLLEQLWALAQERSAAPLQQKIADLTLEAARIQAHALTLSETCGSLRAESDELARQLNVAAEGNARLSRQIDEARQSHEEQVRALNHSISEAALLRASEARQAEMALDANRRASEVALAAERHLRSELSAQHTAVVADLRGNVEAAKAVLDRERIEHALAIDGLRQDAREAQARTDRAEAAASQERAEQARLRDVLATQSIDLARAQMRLEQDAASLVQTRDKIASLEQIVEELRAAQASQSASTEGQAATSIRDTQNPSPSA